MKIIVTGGAGFIGSHLSDRLLELGHDVYVVDDLSTGSLENLSQNIRRNLYYLDICSQQQLEHCFSSIKPNIVYHLAAQIDVRKSILNPTLDAEINVVGTLNVLKQCIANNVSKVIFSSSGGAIYKEGGDRIKAENSVLGPTSPYGISKMLAEQYIQFYKNIYSLNNCIFRFSNVYGERQVSHKCGILGIFLENHFSGKQSIIFGDGSQTRDFIDAHSVVDALILGMKINGTFNVSSGVETCVNQIAESLKKHIPFDWTYGPKVEGEMLHNCLSSNLLKSYGWSPKMTLDEGIERTINWFKECKK